MRPGILAALTCAALIAIGAGAAQAAAPANDDFAAATPLAVGAEAAGSTVEATAEPGEPEAPTDGKSAGCAKAGDAPTCATTVWYTVQPSQAGPLTIETCDAGTEIDTVLAVFTGASVGGATLVEENDDAPSCSAGILPRGSQLTISATAGTVYHVSVGGFSGGEGAVYVRAYSGPPQSRPVPDTAIPPDLSLAAKSHSGAPGARGGRRHSPSFPLRSIPAGGSFECSLDETPFAPCVSPVSYEGLTPGSFHVFRARAVVAGVADPTPAIQRFTLDTTPPQTSIFSGPSGALAESKAKWQAIGSERNDGGEVDCWIDDVPYTSCSTGGKEFKELCRGPHSFFAAATDMASNTDPSPASLTVDVTTGSPCAGPAVGITEILELTPTRAEVNLPVADGGAGGGIHFEYGTTTSYGSEGIEESVNPSGAMEGRPLVFSGLTPNTLYHYQATLTTPFGTASTGDRIFATPPLTGTLPGVQNGAPVLSPYAARIPVTVDPNGVDTGFELLVAQGRPALGSRTAFSGAIVDDAEGTQQRAIDLVDLDPGTTYSYRFAAHHQGSDSNEVLGPEARFTTPLPQAVLTKPRVRFRLRRGNLKLTALTRSSTRLKLRVKGLPGKSTVNVKLKVGPSKQTARRKASKAGSARFRPTLSKRIRKALRSTNTKKYRVRVTVTPPGESSSTVTLTKTLKPAKRR